MIRIVHVFGRMDRGGAETLVMNIYRRIDRSIIQFDFVVHTEEKCDYDDEIFSLGGKIYKLPRFNGCNTISYKKKWKELLYTHSEWSTIHAHMCSTASIFLPIAKKYGLHTIAHSHTISSGNGFSAVIKNLLQKRINADYYFACSTVAAKWLFGKDVLNNQNFRIIHNAIDVEQFQYDEYTRTEVRKELKIGKSILIGHIGIFRIEKNHRFILDVFHSVLERVPSAKLVLIGNGPLYDEIRKYAGELSVINNILFLGSREDVNRFLQAMDVFLFPSLFEGFGIAVLEAQASGLPCLISEFVPNECLITDLVKRMSLNDSISKWADLLISLASISRRNTCTEIKNSGFDITENVRWIQNFYFSLADGE